VIELYFCWNYYWASVKT